MHQMYTVYRRLPCHDGRVLKRAAPRDTRQTRSLLPRSDLDYYARVDTDSRIVSPIAYDLFEHMRERELYYGYVVKMFEHPSAPRTLHACTAASPLTRMGRDVHVSML